VESTDCTVEMHHIRCIQDHNRNFAFYMMHSALSEIGVSIAQARKAAGKSQASLGAALGMSRATISGIEKGTVREIGVRKLMALCAALGLEILVAPRRTRPTLDQLREEQRAAKNRA
jgi:HTH-type transcriptional regulator / antitoxin HipB